MTIRQLSSLSCKLMLALLCQSRTNASFLIQSTRNFRLSRVASNVVPSSSPCLRQVLLERRHPSSTSASVRDTENHHQATNDGKFLEQVETTVARVLQDRSVDDVLQLPPNQRETFGVAKHLDKRLQAFRRNNDCPRCWLQKAHCVCSNMFLEKAH